MQTQQNGTVMTIPAVARELSPRQRDVLALLVAGFSVRQAADSLGIGYATVKKHTLDLYERLGVHNRAQCVHLAHEAGLVHGLPEVGLPPPRKRKPEPSFEKVGMVHRMTDQPEVIVSTTHVLRVKHPTDESQSWWLDLSVLDDAQALARQEQAADWVDFVSKVTLYRVGEQGSPLREVWGTRED